ncbi:uncharacterized protein F4817DRAFT_316923 [Daldinia loculata]|uniref:uncharacterized protein n=1 Tax=Daldinia loculata TaxID=103429 RepID=UPI0020C4E9C6|nr:uncharacterized protein F4817DRAFT_316923 [Daldinia loculata]KAI1646428.1 hypothetical protein F4817DRAFT_316923 [Daldinia loculata]
MANLRQQPSSFRRSLLGFIQAVFALALFAIFVIVWLVQGGSIPLPEWAKAWNGVSPELQRTYAAALVPAVCILAVLFIGDSLPLPVPKMGEKVDRNQVVHT